MQNTEAVILHMYIQEAVLLHMYTVQNTETVPLHMIQNTGTVYPPYVCRQNTEAVLLHMYTEYSSSAPTHVYSTEYGSSASTHVYSSSSPPKAASGRTFVQIYSLYSEEKIYLPFLRASILKCSAWTAWSCPA